MTTEYLKVFARTVQEEAQHLDDLQDKFVKDKNHDGAALIDHRQQELSDFVHLFVLRMKQDNPSFNEELFLENCGFI